MSDNIGWSGISGRPADARTHCSRPMVRNLTFGEAVRRKDSFLDRARLWREIINRQAVTVQIVFL